MSRDSEIATVECQVTLLDQLKDIKHRVGSIPDQMMFSCCLDEAETSPISLNLAIMRIMTLAVGNFSENIESELWDSILCSMLEWLQVRARSIYLFK